MRRFELAILAFAVLIAGCAKKENDTPEDTGAATPPVEIKVGHVGHDHHIALFVGMDHADKVLKGTGLSVKKIKDKTLYELYDGTRKLADVEIVRVGGGSKMPTALAQGVIDVGFGGIVPTLASTDKGSPVRVIAPLHAKGDMLVVRPDLPVNDWASFVDYVKKSNKPVRIGYKAPIAVAKIIFEEALRHEGLSFSGDVNDRNVQVHMINAKGGGKLNTALSGGLVDGYTGNNPFPAIGKEKGLLKIVCDLEDLPPGNLRDHPCCCIAANTNAVKEKREAIVALLSLFCKATDLIHSDRDAAVATASRWIGTSEAVERNSIPTSEYSMDPTESWHNRMKQWLKIMQGLDVFSGSLKTATPEELPALAYDLEPLQKAQKRLEM